MFRAGIAQKLSHWLSTSKPHLFHLVQHHSRRSSLNHLNLLFLSSTDRSLTPHISTTSLLDLLSCHLTSATYVSILWSKLLEYGVLSSLKHYTSTGKEEFEYSK
ncbi:hypothetical protein E2C01_023463 [Portunus trituberculatus]|uniref:Uncharacterized protein n=1 Tax=Portunus trituberculatus TaxID=210409 RepID=A0A5B7EB73_PORTR|nr:hypothetical protein [Portunus trituberculatus]